MNDDFSLNQVVEYSRKDICIRNVLDVWCSRVIL